MALKRIERNTGGADVRLTECPFCGEWFGEKPNGSVRVDHFLNEHGPEVIDPDFSPTERQSGLDEWAGAD